MMSYTKMVAGAALLLAVAGCSAADMSQQAATPAPSGLRNAGSASVTGGAAAAPAGVGTVGKSTY